MKLWNIEGKELTTLKGHSATVWGVNFSHDGRIIASASADRTIKLWTQDGKLLKTLIGHSDEVTGVVFSPEGKIIASTASALRQAMLKTIEKHPDPKNWAAFTLIGESN